MNKIKIIKIIIIGIASLINIYVIINLFLEKNKKEKDYNYIIKNNKFIISIVIIFMLYLIYGIIRNFE